MAHRTDELWKHVLADADFWSGLLADTEFWRQVAATPKDERAALFLARYDSAGLGESDEVQAIRARQLADVAALVELLGLDRTRELLAEKRH